MTVRPKCNCLYVIYLSVVINGNWGAWYAINQCSATCGNGVKTRERKCNNPAPNGGKPCEGPTSQVIKCTLGFCSGMKVVRILNPTDKIN